MTSAAERLTAKTRRTRSQGNKSFSLLRNILRELRVLRDKMNRAIRFCHFDPFETRVNSRRNLSGSSFFLIVIFPDESRNCRRPR